MKPEKVFLVHEPRDSWVKEERPFADKHSVSRFLASDSEIASIAEAVQQAGFDVEILRFPENSRPALKKIIEAYDSPCIFWNLSDGDDYFVGAKVPAFAEFIEKPFVGSSTFTQALVQNKYYTNLLLENAGIATPRSIYFTKQNYATKLHLLESFDFPCFIKPAALDNSVAYEKYTPLSQSVDEAIAAINKLFNEEIDHVLIEEFLPGKECTVPALHNKSWEMLAIEQLYQGEYLGVEIKEEYEGVKAREYAVIDDSDELLRTARSIIDLLSIKDYCRMDFRADSNGDYKFLEVNTGTFLTTAAFTKYADVKYKGDSSAMFTDLIVGSYRRQVKA